MARDDSLLSLAAGYLRGGSSSEQTGSRSVVPLGALHRLPGRRPVTGKARFTDASTRTTLVELTSGRKLRLRTVEAPNTEEERGSRARMLAHMENASIVRRSSSTPASTSRRSWAGLALGARVAVGLDALVRAEAPLSRRRRLGGDAQRSDRYPSALERVSRGRRRSLVRMDDEKLRNTRPRGRRRCAESELRDTLLALAEARDDLPAEAALALLRR